MVVCPFDTRPAGSCRVATIASLVATTGGEELFPGLTRDVTAAGGLCVDLQNDCRWYQDGNLLRQEPSGLLGLLASRPLLEATVRSHARALGNVTIRDGASCDRLLAEGGTVCGAVVEGIDVPADLVVDATGQGSRTPRWLADLGREVPEINQVPVDLAYASRVYRRHPEHLDGDTLVSIRPTPQVKRSGSALAMEGNRWLITLGGYRGERPPLDSKGYESFADTILSGERALPNSAKRSRKGPGTSRRAHAVATHDDPGFTGTDDTSSPGTTPLTLRSSINVSSNTGTTTSQGQAVYVFRGANGYDYIVKSTSWVGDAAAFTATTAGFSGKATIIVVDPRTGTQVGGGVLARRVLASARWGWDARRRRPPTCPTATPSRCRPGPVRGPGVVDHVDDVADLAEVVEPLGVGR